MCSYVQLWGQKMCSYVQLPCFLSYLSIQISLFAVKPFFQTFHVDAPEWQQNQNICKRGFWYKGGRGGEGGEFFLKKTLCRR